MEILLKMLPIFLGFFSGVGLQKSSVLNLSAGDTLLKIVFYITAPFLIVATVLKAPISNQITLYPILIVLCTVASYMLAKLFAQLSSLEPIKLGVCIIGSMIVNGSFVLPFVLQAYGQEGFSKFVFADITIAIFVLTWVYWISVKYGSTTQSSSQMLKKLAVSPPLWALLVGMLGNIAQIQLPTAVDSAFITIGTTTGVLIPLALGLKFSLKLATSFVVYITIAIRMLGGLMVGLLFVWLTGATGMDKSIMLLLASAPVGYNTITFASINKLDTELAATTVSVSIVLGLIIAPIVIVLTS